MPAANRFLRTTGHERLRLGEDLKTAMSIKVSWPSVTDRKRQKSKKRPISKDSAMSSSFYCEKAARFNQIAPACRDFCNAQNDQSGESSHFGMCSIRRRNSYNRGELCAQFNSPKPD